MMNGLSRFLRGEVIYCGMTVKGSRNKARQRRSCEWRLKRRIYF